MTKKQSAAAAAILAAAAAWITWPKVFILAAVLAILAVSVATVVATLWKAAAK